MNNFSHLRFRTQIILPFLGVTTDGEEGQKDTEVGATLVLGSNRILVFFKERPQITRTKEMKSRKRGQTILPCMSAA